MKAFIAGVTGQDGFYLSKLLKEKGYEVYGLVRRTAQTKDIPDVEIIPGDITDPGLVNIIEDINPDEIYNLAAMSFVWESFKVPKTTFDINAIGTLHCLEGARKTGARFYQASTSELFGASPPPQNEKTPFYPRSPYGVSKLAAYWLTVNYRDSYDLFACNGILFNHESPRRGIEFVTQKISSYVAQIYLDLRVVDLDPKDAIKLPLGNLDAIHDWGHAEDFVDGMWRMLQQDDPGDYVLATGKGHTIKGLLDVAFSHIGISDWTPYVEIDPKFYRPTEVNALIGDATKAKEIGWEPKHSFESMIREMIDAKIQPNN